MRSTPAGITSSDTLFQSRHVVLPIRLGSRGRCRGAPIVQGEHPPCAQPCRGVQGVLQDYDMGDHGMLLADEGSTAHEERPAYG